MPGRDEKDLGVQLEKLESTVLLNFLGLRSKGEQSWQQQPVSFW
jgi:hypothetical protein